MIGTTQFRRNLAIELLLWATSLHGMSAIIFLPKFSQDLPIKEEAQVPLLLIILTSLNLD